MNCKENRTVRKVTLYRKRVGDFLRDEGFGDIKKISFFSLFLSGGTVSTSVGIIHVNFFRKSIWAGIILYISLVPIFHLWDYLIGMLYCKFVGNWNVLRVFFSSHEIGMLYCKFVRNWNVSQTFFSSHESLKVFDNIFAFALWYEKEWIYIVESITARV
jgi:hypothetical protein